MRYRGDGLRWSPRRDEEDAKQSNTGRRSQLAHEVMQRAESDAGRTGRRAEFEFGSRARAQLSVETVNDDVDRVVTGDVVDDSQLYRLGGSGLGSGS